MLDPCEKSQVAVMSAHADQSVEKVGRHPASTVEEERGVKKKLMSVAALNESGARLAHGLQLSGGGVHVVRLYRAHSISQSALLSKGGLEIDCPISPLIHDLLAKRSAVGNFYAASPKCRSKSQCCLSTAKVYMPR